MNLHEITALLRERVVRDAEGYKYGGSAGFSDEQYREAAERVATVLEDVCQRTYLSPPYLLTSGTFKDVLTESTDSDVTIWNGERRAWYAEDPDAPEWVDSVLSRGLTQPPANETELLRVLGAAIYLQLEAANEAVLAWIAEAIEEAD